MIFASVVLPTPGGPQKIIELVSSLSICTRNGLPGAQQMLLADELVERARAHPLGQRLLPRVVWKFSDSRGRRVSVSKRLIALLRGRSGPLPRCFVEQNRSGHGGVQDSTGPEHGM